MWTNLTMLVEEGIQRASDSNQLRVIVTSETMNTREN